MTRLLVHVEGETEETFVNEVLRPYLIAVGYERVGARLVGNARARMRRGGIRSWDLVKRDIIRHLSSDPGCIATTMVDYYALPGSWPGRTAASLLPPSQRGSHIHDAIRADMEATTPYWLRFEPFVVVHEFEALLFSDCQRFADGIGHAAVAAPLAAIRAQFSDPEEINDDPNTAPSKRVMTLIPDYQKVISGTVAALEIGLERIREECPNFRAWLTRLEQRAAPGP